MLRILALLAQIFALVLVLMVCLAAVPSDSFLGWIREAILR